MNKYLLLVILGLGLSSCKKDDAENPAVVTAGFNQDFSLYSQQQASLPLPTQPELAIAVTDLRFSICPRNANCLVADYAVPTLRITDAQGSMQQLNIPTNFYGRRTSDWIDTTSVRANGRRYLLTYVNWQVQGDYYAATKENIKLTFRVSR
ncbi:hypothetical protein [Hymenobacter convexus]|uniref:hypothetical protein n=1 Tax=Hymenobacter sp. CA1UV-4 TaxID=3063782 RepID=UPI002712FD83|nr:hypothetical protein [Hymenobacter sp. CA1UV-4]MDO7854174.1 hypothetical protein [Hymenobacter sp. CA1UV-4]